MEATTRGPMILLIKLCLGRPSSTSGRSSRMWPIPRVALRTGVASAFLIDVHNYSHIDEGPGILLVAHQSNFSIDMTDDRMGLRYYRKQPVETLTEIIKPAVEGCRLLENDPRLRDRLRFHIDEVLVVTNDRLLAPNNDETFSTFEAQLSSALNQVLGKTFKLSRISDDPKERLTIRAVTITVRG